jgi:L-ascorbate 6-phosphate lactonase
MNPFYLTIKSVSLGRTHLFSVGQAGYIIKSKDGSLLGLDLYLSDCVERVEGHVGFKRLLPKLMYPFELEFDYLIATHPHYDHFDIDSIPQLMSNNRTVLFASARCKIEIERLQMQNSKIRYVIPGDTHSVGTFKLEFVNCDHGSGAPDAVGVVVTIDDKRILFAGDTCLRLDRVGEYIEKGPLDVLIAPINGAYGNLNERDCAILSNNIKPKLTIPSHYGMFASHGGSLADFILIMNSEYPHLQYLVMCQGEQYTFIE